MGKAPHMMVTRIPTLDLPTHYTVEALEEALDKDTMKQENPLFSHQRHFRSNFFHLVIIDGRQRSEILLVGLKSG